MTPPTRVVSEEKGWWEGDDGPQEEFPKIMVEKITENSDGSISWKLNVFDLIQLIPIVGTAIWIIVEIL